MRPVSFISHVPKELQRGGRAAGSAKRSQAELEDGVKEWISKKFERPDKIKLMQSLWDGPWTRELVLNEVKHTSEVEMIEAHGVRVLKLPEIVQCSADGGEVVQSASGADFVDLIKMGLKRTNEAACGRMLWHQRRRNRSTSLPDRLRLPANRALRGPCESSASEMAGRIRGA